VRLGPWEGQNAPVAREPRLPSTRRRFSIRPDCRRKSWSTGEDLIDQLFNSSEKRLARTLLLLARDGKDDTPASVLPKISQETLAEMVGTTRARVNFFLNKFRDWDSLTTAMTCHSRFTPRC